MIPQAKYSTDRDSDNTLTENRTFDLISLIIEGLHQGSESLIVEEHELLLNTASGIQVGEYTKIIVIESEITEQGDKVSIYQTGSIIVKPDSNQPFSLFYSLNRSDLSRDLTLNKSGLWSVSIHRPANLQDPPLVLHDSVFSLELHTKDQFGSPYSLGYGRGFMIIGDNNIKIH